MAITRTLSLVESDGTADAVLSSRGPFRAFAQAWLEEARAAHRSIVMLSGSANGEVA